MFKLIKQHYILFSLMALLILYFAALLGFDYLHYLEDPEVYEDLEKYGVY